MVIGGDLDNNGLVKKERNYGIDLLRVVSMFFVVVLHVISFPQLNGYYQANSLGYDITWFLYAFAVCAVNVYAMISGYVLLNSKFKLKRLLGLWLEVFFFNVISYVLLVITRGTFNGIIDFIKGMIDTLPLYGEAIWYFKAYFLLYLLFPIMNIAIKNMTKAHFVLLFFVIGIVFCIISNYGGYNWHLSGGYSTIWLIVMYFIGAYFKKFGLPKITVAKALLFYCIMSLVIFIGLIVNNFLIGRFSGSTAFFDIIRYDTYAYTSIFVVLQSVFLFIAFAKTDIKNSALKKAVSFLAPLTFGIYVVHCTTFGWSLFEHLKFMQNYSVWLIIPFTIGFAVLIFTACAVIEWVRQIIFKYCGIDKLTDKTGDFIQEKLNGFAGKKEN